MCDIRWKGLGTGAHVDIELLLEKHDIKTAGLSNSPGTDMIPQAKTARNVSILATFQVLEFLREHPNEYRLWSPECTKTASKEAQRAA